MAGTVQVSYLIIGVYVTFVVGSSLLVGLLPPFVNLPTCDDTPSARVVEPKIELDLKQQEPIVQRERREVESSVVVGENVYEEKIKRFREQIPDLDARLFKRHGYTTKSISNLTVCSEILKPEAGVQYPWYKPRLPATTTPTNYEIELYLELTPIDIYDGAITITFELTESTQYLLLHVAANDLPFIQSLKDKDGNDVDVSCVGEFLFLRNDYYILKTTEFMQPAKGPYKASFVFLDIFTEFDTGIFKLQYGAPGENKTMFASMFEPIFARRAYPVFDEPGFKAPYEITILHRKDWVAATNTPVEKVTPDPVDDRLVETKFVKTPPMPSYLIAYTVFDQNDFAKVSATANGGIPINVWAQKRLVDAGFADAALETSVKVFNGLLDIFRNVNGAALPPKIDILAVPEYPKASVGHFGLPMFPENKILFKEKTASAREKQNVALLIAKTLAEFWFGNFVTFSFWDELWLEEALTDYIKYRAVEEAYPDWNILDQFITEELISTLINDGFPSSHPIQKPINNPYEIEEYFDDVETSKAAALLRWVESEFNVAQIYEALTNYLNSAPWGDADIKVFYNALGKIGPKNWPADEFFARWVLQPNYPLVFAELIDNGNSQSIRFTQSRGLNTNYSIFAGELLYPSPYDWVWWIPIDCSFGTGPSAVDDVAREREFYLDKKTETFALPAAPAGKKWTWAHCDREFVGYFELDYTRENWSNLGKALKEKNPEFTAEDRANIIHNLFLNSYSLRGDYFELREVVEFLKSDQDYLPWRAAYIHLKQIAEILQYRKAFFQFAEFFGFLLNGIENGINIFQPTEIHIEELLRETVADLACTLADAAVLDEVSRLWLTDVPNLLSGNFEASRLPPFVREIVYNYHIQNTYDVGEWETILFDYDNILDEFEQRRLLESLTYTRLPWLLARIVKEIGTTYVRKNDEFEVIRQLSYSPLGREIAWDYIRINFKAILERYGEDDPRIGRAILDIVYSFENEFLFYELLQFVFFTNTGATANARFRALETVSTNIVWLNSKEDEIIQAFSVRGKQESTPNVNPLLDGKWQKTQAFLTKAKQEFSKLYSENREVFPQLKSIL